VQELIEEADSNMEPIDQNSILIPIDVEQINSFEERKNSGGGPINQRENWISL
jgi:hypothetical protein